MGSPRRMRRGDRAACGPVTGRACTARTAICSSPIAWAGAARPASGVDVDSFGRAAVAEVTVAALIAGGPFAALRAGFAPGFAGDAAVAGPPAPAGGPAEGAQSWSGSSGAEEFAVPRAVELRLFEFGRAVQARRDARVHPVFAEAVARGVDRREAVDRAALRVAAVAVVAPFTDIAPIATGTADPAVSAVATAGAAFGFDASCFGRAVSVATLPAASADSASPPGPPKSLSPPVPPKRP